MTEEPLDPFVDVPDEMGRYALRTFAFASVCPTKELADKIGWWTDNTCKMWRSVTDWGDRNDWLDGTCTATCFQGQRRAEHSSPDEHCGCGIFGSLSYADLILQFRRQVRNIVAVIAAEGVTLIGDRGLRTQYARVVAYWVCPDEIMRQVAREQFIDAVAYDDPDEMITAYGLALLPPADANQNYGTEYWA